MTPILTLVLAWKTVETGDIEDITNMVISNVIAGRCVLQVCVFCTS